MATVCVDPCESFPWVGMVAPMALENMVSEVVEAVIACEAHPGPPPPSSQQEEQPKGLESASSSAIPVKLVASDIYCQGELLHVVQMSSIFTDSKTFVDMKVRESPEYALKQFALLMNKTENNPSTDQVKEFVDETFEDGDELQEWVPTDWVEEPKLLALISNTEYRDWTAKLNKLWLNLGRKVKEDVLNKPELYSLLYVPNGFVIPGGRFKELYYWDTYWIVQGLLACDMTDTVKGVIGNLLHLVKKLGFIPNGSRVYYEERSQPPLLIAMVRSYYDKTGDLQFIEDNIDVIEKEFDFWMNNSLVDIEVDSTKYQLARYYAPSNGPRPESYREDVESTEHLADQTDERNKMYWELKSGAASGWDFSSRWFIDSNGSNSGGLKNIRTSMIAPVDLNAILYGAARGLQYFKGLLGTARDRLAAAKYGEIADKLRTAVESVLWNDEDGIWYDYDILHKKQRPFFFGSNIAPLWTDCYDTNKQEKIAAQVVKYINNSGILNYYGGTPSSLNYTGEQWDFPNCWAPLQSYLIQGLDRTKQAAAQKLAAEFADRWLNANFVGFNKTQTMFEKYDAENIGQFGGGGEYTVQEGFGWTNGFVFELIKRYHTNNPTGSSAAPQGKTAAGMFVLPLLVSYYLIR